MPRDQAREKSALGPGAKPFFSWFLALSLTAPFSMGSPTVLDKPSQEDLELLQRIQARTSLAEPLGVSRRRGSRPLWSAAAALIFPPDEKLLAGTSCNSSTIPLGQTTRDRITRDAFADPE